MSLSIFHRLSISLLCPCNMVIDKSLSQDPQGSGLDILPNQWRVYRGGWGLAGDESHVQAEYTRLLGQTSGYKIITISGKSSQLPI